MMSARNIAMGGAYEAMGYRAETIGGNPAGGEEKTDDTMKQKLENFATSYIETIAAKRKRNVECAKSSVKESAAISSEKALDLNVIDIIAKDLPDLLKQLDGREVNDKALKTTDAEVVEIPMVAREKVFQLLWRPEVMFLLMLMAIYGIIGELSNPGAILPGVVGGIALILALYMAAILPVNIAGLALIGLAILLFIADIYATTLGVLTAGGIISFLLGAHPNQARTGNGRPLLDIVAEGRAVRCEERVEIGCQDVATAADADGRQAAASHPMQDPTPHRCHCTRNILAT